MSYFLCALKKFATFPGRARRAEFWYFYLFYCIISIIINLLDEFGAPAILVLFLWACTLPLLVPYLAVTVRRLHDIGKSGYWVFINLIPIIGQIWSLVLQCTDSQPGANQYGRNPKEAERQDTIEPIQTEI